MPISRGVRRAAAVWLWVWGGAWTEVQAATPAESDDRYRWLEQIDDERALAWVHARNQRTAERLTARADYAGLYRDALAVLNSASRIPEVGAHGGQLYHLWQDEAHPRGLFRRTTAAELAKAEPRWETVLDVDALAATEGRPWAFGETVWRQPDETRCLIQLSPGGGDAAEVREFDVTRRAFVPGGFVLPVAKSRVAWCDADSLYVGTDFGPGSLTESGYPRVLKRWRRGTPLADAKTIHEGSVKSVWVLANRFGSGDDAVHVLTEAETFWTARYFQIDGDAVRPLAIPATAKVVDAFRGRLVIALREDWAVAGKTFPAGAIVLAEPALLRGDEGAIDLLVANTDSVIVQEAHVGKRAIFVSMLDNVRGRLDRLTPTAEGWTRETIAFPENGALSVISLDDLTGDAWVKFETFTTPPTLYRVPAGTTSPVALKQQAPTFAGENFETRQFWCTSADGTRVPYFVVARKGVRHDGRNPVWMFSYGGFENSLTPSYSGSYEDLHGVYGKLWLERGGVFVLANIRGGGEFGPQWHLGALKENHVKCFEDFEAVARDLVARKITSPTRLGIEGRSNGGLLVAATMLRHPELYGAVVCGNPLLDMQRYHRLLAGASWMAEYGDPDVPAEWAYLSRYSPYQNVRPGRKLPPILFYTTTRDDRVHPGHARKMAAKMDVLGYDVDYYENTEGGHHGSVTSEQFATRVALTFAFLWEKLGAD